MASLVFYGRLVSRAVGGTVVPDSCKEGAPPRGRSTASPAAPLQPRRATTASRVSWLLFQRSLPPIRAALSSSFPCSVFCERLLTRLSPDNAALVGAGALPPLLRPFCSSAVASPLESEPDARSVLALRLVTANFGFAKDNFPPSARRVGTSPGWMESVRRRLRRGEDEASTDPSPTARPTPERAACFGDDSFFVTANQAGDVLGVADGVGGWRTYGIDPSLFSSSLMANCQRVVNEGRSRLDAPKTIIATGYYDLMERSRKTASQRRGASPPTSSFRSSGLVGSSTVCIVAFDRETQHLHAANLGDSGFAIVRNGKVIQRSREQQHYFNTPFQLSLPPRPSSRNNTAMLQDSPDMADSSSTAVKEGDVILVATDGLWDNLDEAMILEEISANLKDPTDEESVSRTARALATRARDLAFDPLYMSPFARNARAAGIDKVVGGKPDDITIILSAVAAR